LASTLFTVMFAWYGARKIKNSFVRFVDIRPYFPIIAELSEDQSVPVFASHLVYLTSANNKNEIESKIMYSFLNNILNRADVYKLVHVDVRPHPHNREYEDELLIPQKLFGIYFKLGFRVEHSISI